MNIDWTLVSSLAAVVAAISAIIALIVQTSHSRRAMAIEMLWKLEARFFSDPVMLENRRRAAKAQLKGETPYELIQVLHVLEIIGSHLRRGFLDRELVWSHFCYWVIYYCAAYRDQIAEEKRTDTTVWSNLDYLFREMTDMDAKKRSLPKERIIPTPQEVSKFLEEESVRV